MDNIVSITGCENYEEDKVFVAVKQCIDNLGGIDKFVKSGQKVALKVNLLMKAVPSKCATTHPAVVGSVARLCREIGAEVIIVDSAGGPFNATYMNAIYKASGMLDVSSKYEVELNQNYDFINVRNEQAVVAKSFDILKTLYDADCIINLCKLKTHAFTGFTNAVKNMFGAIPGLTKVEMHGKYRDISTFCDFLYDINTYFGDKIVLNISDAVDAMEGEGPSNGRPRHIGIIGASNNPIALDIVGVKLMNADPLSMPTIIKAQERGLIQDLDIKIVGEDIDNYVVKDFDFVVPNLNKPFANYVPQSLQKFIQKIMTQRPKIVQKHCKGCQKCFNHCPVHAISMIEKNGKKIALIDYDKCIKCFCCQELCPFGVIKIKSGVVYKLVHINTKKRRK